jgi:predicted N-acyltransferase
VAAQRGVQVHLVLARERGRPCGFVLLAQWGDILYAQHCGHRVEGEAPVYFGTVFYEPIRFALARGLRRIDYSVGSDPAKLRRGCRKVGQRAFVLAFDEAAQTRLSARSGV